MRKKKPHLKNEMLEKFSRRVFPPRPERCIRVFKTWSLNVVLDFYGLLAANLKNLTPYASLNVRI